MIFVCHRRSDADPFVDRLASALEGRFGHEASFADIRHLQPGDQWAEELDQALAIAKVVLVVIGTKWDQLRFHDGRYRGFPRLHDPSDVVRREILASLARGRDVRLVPVLVDRDVLPNRDWLKNFGLQDLHRFQAIFVRSESLDSDIEYLLEELGRINGPAATPSRAQQDSPKVWIPHAGHVLQRAPHFEGRYDLRKELTQWAMSTATSCRVHGIVAPGGTGKTAVVEWVLRQVAVNPAAGVFVWSFYASQHTEAFIRSAIEYFGEGSVDGSAPPTLEMLQTLLSGHHPHLLILDGMELVQAERPGRVHGSFQDSLLRRLLRWIAAGIGTGSRALITTRFPLVDLGDWLGTSVKEIRLEDISVRVGIQVLRAWGVIGTESELREVLVPLQDPRTDRVHALTTAVIGSYVGKMWGGDPSKAPTLSKGFLAQDTQGNKLTKVLTSYADALSPLDRDILSRLSMFPHGIGVRLLEQLAKSGGEVAGSLVGADSLQLRDALAKLRHLGLVFQAGTATDSTYTAHPFLRYYFSQIHGLEDPTSVPEEVRRLMALELDRRPSTRPWSSEELDRYESLIEATLLAGDIGGAYQLYASRLGGFRHVGWKLGAYSRGDRVASRIQEANEGSHPGKGLGAGEEAQLLEDCGAFSAELGNLSRALELFELQRTRAEDNGIPRALRRGSLNVCDVLAQRGEWASLQDIARSVMARSASSDARDDREIALVSLGSSWFWMGEVARADDLFEEAEAIEERELYSRRGVALLDSLLATGHWDIAEARCKANLEYCKERGWLDDVALCESVMGWCTLRRDAVTASTHLGLARQYANRTGHTETSLRCYQLASAVARQGVRLKDAVFEGRNGIELAKSCGMHRWELALRLELARTYRTLGKFEEGVEEGLFVQSAAEDPAAGDCWMSLIALHLVGSCNVEMGRTMEGERQRNLAIARLKQILPKGALERRRRKFGGSANRDHGSDIGLLELLGE